MTLTALITTFMLAVGSPTWIVNYYQSTPLGVEVDVQSTTTPPARYLLLIYQDKIQEVVRVPLDEPTCEKDTEDEAAPYSNQGPLTLWSCPLGQTRCPGVHA